MQNCLFKTFNSSYSFHFLRILHFRILYFYFYCSYVNTCFFTFYPIVSEIVHVRNYLIHELDLENDRGTVETFFLFVITCFYNKIFHTRNVKWNVPSSKHKVLLTGLRLFLRTCGGAFDTLVVVKLFFLDLVSFAFTRWCLKLEGL